MVTNDLKPTGDAQKSQIHHVYEKMSLKKTRQIKKLIPSKYSWISQEISSDDRKGCSEQCLFIPVWNKQTKRSNKSSKTLEL